MDFEQLLERFYSRLDLRGAIAVDVGAHVGRHAIPLARQIGIGGLVYAFEPLPDIRARLCQNVHAAGLSNVIVCPFALANERKTAGFNFVPNLPEESGLKRRHEYNSPPSEFVQLEVGVFRLQDLVPAALGVSFIKIDVEGGELDVLEGAVETISASRPVVAFECGAASFLGYHEKPDRIFEIYRQLAYEIYAITGEHMKSLTDFATAAHAQNFWDYVAFPAERAHSAVALLTE